MTPAARVATAIDLLDAIIGGEAAEKVLTGWARKSRFAGSGDRAAVRDLVFDALRCRRSFAWAGGAETGRGIMIGAARSGGVDPVSLFTGEGYAPAPLTGRETAARDLADAPLAVQLDMPDWLIETAASSLGDDMTPILRLMRERAAVFLRVNLRLSSRERAADLLREDGIETRPHPMASGALIVQTNARKIQTSKIFQDGLVELQDAGSQAVVEALTLPAGARVLDYCAGGGGKALAIAARADLVDVQVFAHDIDPARMRDIPVRAARAAVRIPCLETAQLIDAGPFDLVLGDAPCSGSGAWRRAPDAKWRLTPERLREFCAVQARILDAAAPLVATSGQLAYATCSLFDCENRDQIEAFLARTKGWDLGESHRFTPLDGGDGFFLGVFRRLTDRA